MSATTLFGVTELFQNQALYDAAYAANPNDPGAARIAAAIAHIQQAADLGVQVIRYPGDWRAYESTKGVYNSWYVDEAAAVLKYAQDHGIKVVMEFAQTPYWASLLAGNTDTNPDSQKSIWYPPTGDAADAYAKAMVQLASALNAKGVGSAISAWEVWNEPNTTTFWSTATLRPGTDVQADLGSAAGYVNLLNKAYDALHTFNPAIKVLGGSLAGNDAAYLDQMYKLGAKYDALAVHPYAKANPDNGGIAYGATDAVNPNDLLSETWSFKAGVEALHKVQLAHNDARHMWFTEFGWSSTADWGGAGSAAVQARFTGEALGLIRGWDFVDAAMLYQQFDGPWDQFGLRTTTGALKQAGSVFTDLNRYLKTGVALFGDTAVNTSEAGAASFAAATHGIAADLDTVNGWTSALKLAATQSIGKLVGGNFADTLTGDARANTLLGGAGNDTLVGGAGADMLDGGAGIDTASYATAKAGVDARLLDPGSNKGDAAGDRYFSIENLQGSDFNDFLYGNDVDNTVNGGAGNDEILGLLGNDTLNGDAGNDRIFGGDGADKLSGGAGTDNLFGEAGNDRLDGGAGNDYMVGGTGNDNFVFKRGYGSDRIADFAAGAGNLNEWIDVSDFGIGSFAALQRLMTQANGSTTIRFADGSQLTLEGVAKLKLVADDFHF
jgi:Ca2+-binding RTX toxin-like protein